MDGNNWLQFVLKIHLMEDRVITEASASCNQRERAIQVVLNSTM